MIWRTNELREEWYVIESDPQVLHSYQGAVVGGKCVMPPAYSPQKVSEIRQSSFESLHDDSRR